jgi:outer membrane protein TolC
MNKRTLTACLALGLFAPAAGAQDAPVLTLEQAKELCRKNSYTIRAAQEKLVQAETLIDKAWVMVKPQLNAVGTYTHNDKGVSLSFPMVGSGPMCPNGENLCYLGLAQADIQKSDTLSFIASLQQPLFLARAYTAIKMANQGYDLAKLNIENLEDYLLHTVEMAYLGALTTQKFVSIAQHAVEVRSEHLKIAQAKFEVGDQPKITVLRAGIDVKKAEQDLRSAENGLAMAKEAIALLIGRPDAAFGLQAPTLASRPAASLEDFIARAQAERRDLSLARLNLELAEKTELDAWLRFAPSLLFTGMFRASDTKGFTDEYYTWNIGLTLSLPLYDGGLRYAYIDEAESKIREARVAMEEKQAAIRSEIRQLWLRLELAESNLAKARESLTLAQEQVELARVSFDAGAITNLEVTDANLGLFVAEINAAQEELNLELAIRNLEKATRMFNPLGSAASASAGGSSTGGGSEMGGAAGGQSTSGMGM